MNKKLLVIKEKRKKMKKKLMPVFQRQGEQKTIDTIFDYKDPCDN